MGVYIHVEEVRKTERDRDGGSLLSFHSTVDFLVNSMKNVLGNNSKVKPFGLLSAKRAPSGFGCFCWKAGPVIYILINY